eukprot:Awhi_evm1s15085
MTLQFENSFENNKNDTVNTGFLVLDYNMNSRVANFQNTLEFFSEKNIEVTSILFLVPDLSSEQLLEIASQLAKRRATEGTPSSKELQSTLRPELAE